MTGQAESREATGVDGSEASAAFDASDENSLSERDRTILAFEGRGWMHAGAKEEAIRSDLALSAARYYQLLNSLIDAPAAIVAEPMLVRRLQRVRETKTHARPARTGSSATGPSRTDD